MDSSGSTSEVESGLRPLHGTSIARPEVQLPLEEGFFQFHPKEWASKQLELNSATTVLVAANSDRNSRTSSRVNHQM